MKRISVLLLAFALALCACVPKPERDAARQSDDGCRPLPVINAIDRTPIFSKQGY